MLVDVHQLPFRTRCPHLRHVCYTTTGNLKKKIVFEDGEVVSTKGMFSVYGLGRRLNVGIYEGNVNLHAALEGILDETARSFGVLDPMHKGMPTVRDHKWLRRVYSAFGVADNIQQVLDKLSAFINHPTRTFVLGVVWNKKDRGDNFRWHKWGPYIGIQEPQCEHFKDEPTVDRVMFYHLYEVKLP